LDEKEENGVEKKKEKTLTFFLQHYSRTVSSSRNGVRELELE